MELPGVEREHQAGRDELARSFVLGRDGMALSPAWDQRVERDAQEADRQRVRAEERERRGLPPEPEQGRERQRQSRGLGLGGKRNRSLPLSSMGILPSLMTGQGRGEHHHSQPR